MKFVEFSEQYLDAYRCFLKRIGNYTGEGSLGMPFSYYLSSPGITIRRHLVIDETADPVLVVGAINVKLQDYIVAGRIAQIAVVTYPVSLGIVDSRYGMVGVFLFKKLAQNYPLNFLLGMGPPETNVVARLVGLLGWTLHPIPYLFMPMRLAPLVQKQLSSRPALAGIVRLADTLRVFWLGEAILHAISRRRQRPNNSLRIVPVTQFDAALDDFWHEYAQEVSFSLVRDCTQMNSMFPNNIPEFEKLAFFWGTRLVGFAVLLIPSAKQSARFADAKVGTLVELCLLNEHVQSVAAALASYLLGKDLDAAITNTPHGETIQCLKHCGFLLRTTNVYMAASRQLQALLERHNIGLKDMVVTRGDGDGPIGLGVDL